MRRPRRIAAFLALYVAMVGVLAAVVDGATTAAWNPQFEFEFEDDIDAVDTDVMGLKLFRRLGAGLAQVVDLSGNVVRAVGDTAAGTVGVSVKIAGLAVKGLML